MNDEPEAHWRTIDLRPAPPGWRALYVDDNGRTWTAPLIGWAIQEDAPAGERDRWHPPADRDRQIVPATADPANGPEPWVIQHDDEQFFCLIAPGDEPPPPGVIDEHVRVRARLRQRAQRFDQAIRTGGSLRDLMTPDPPP